MTPIKPESIRPLARGTLRLQSDERLLKLFRRGIEPAFDELVNRYRAALVGYAGSIAGRDRAEDVVQDSLVKAHRSLQADRDIEPRPWLYSVVRNTALNDVRDNRKHRHDDLADSAGPGDSTDDLVEQRERFALVLAAVADLPPAQRRALVDHELSGFSHEEIAAELDLSTGATKQLIYRARISLRNAFGAMIPIPLIAWLVEGSGVIATGAAGTGATATGLIGSIGGGSAAKLAVVAVVAGGSLAGGIAVEKQQSLKNQPDRKAWLGQRLPPAPSIASDGDGSELTETITVSDSSGSGGSERPGRDGDDDRATPSGERESETGRRSRIRWAVTTARAGSGSGQRRGGRPDTGRNPRIARTAALAAEAGKIVLPAGGHHGSGEDDGVMTRVMMIPVMVPGHPRVAAVPVVPVVLLAGRWQAGRIGRRFRRLRGLEWIGLRWLFGRFRIRRFRR